jgi:Rrf2 family nitric oxide-sensitive transcriptional repressor
MAQDAGGHRPRRRHRHELNRNETHGLHRLQPAGADLPGGPARAAGDHRRNRLTKVVHFLGKAGWLANVRGKGGGLALGELPEAIGVGAVVRQTEGQAVVAECFGEEGGNCCIAPVCHLRGVLGEAVSAFYGVLDRYTLADLVKNRKQLASILFVDRAPRPAAPRARP